MDFIFLALALQLLFLAVLILLSSDQNKLRLKSAFSSKLRQIPSLIFSYLQKWVRPNSFVSGNSQSRDSVFPDSYFYDYELKTETVSQKSPNEGKTIETGPNETRINLLLFLCSFSTKTIEFHSNLKNWLMEFLWFFIPQDSVQFDFSQLANGVEQKMPEREMLGNDKMVGSFIGKMRNGMSVSPFRPVDLHGILKRKIKRKILKLEVALMRCGNGKVLSTIQELPELENASCANET